ncbi:MAG: PIN domain-containing protein [Candidatus Omnitrophica bacterium]|nr:PIN domain-containing protein [Candidatus Omnitrophota bacterium]
MKVLFDTSALVAAMVEPHPFHARALPWLIKVKKGQAQGIIASHTVAELYAVLTTLPVVPRILPAMAWKLIHENVEEGVQIVPLSAGDYLAVLRRMNELHLTGGAVYDALIARVAEKAAVQHLVTFNPDDFKRVWPEGEGLLLVP